MSSALSGLVDHSSAVVAAGVTPTRMGNSHPSLFRTTRCRPPTAR